MYLASVFIFGSVLQREPLLWYAGGINVLQLPVNNLCATVLAFCGVKALGREVHGRHEDKQRELLTKWFPTSIRQAFLGRTV